MHRMEDTDTRGKNIYNRRSELDEWMTIDKMMLVERRLFRMLKKKKENSYDVMVCACYSY